MAEKEKNNNVKTSVNMRILLSILVVGFVVLLSLQAIKSDVVVKVVSNLGYLGVLFVATLSGFNIAVPIPAVAFIPLFTASGLSFWPLIFVMTFGMTLGDSLGYLVGNTGRTITHGNKEGVKNGKIYRSLEAFREKHLWWSYALLFIYVSFVPGPNELLVIPMAFLGYRLKYMFPIIFTGNLIFNSVAALGITELIRLF